MRRLPATAKPDKPGVVVEPAQRRDHQAHQRDDNPAASATIAR